MQLRKSRSKKSSAMTFIPLTEAELHELIATRAYELYLQRASSPGNELTDWLEAETDVRATIDKLATTTPAAHAPKAEKPAVSPAKTPRTTRVRPRTSTRKPPLEETPA